VADVERYPGERWADCTAAMSRSVRVRSEREVVRGAGQTFGLPPGVDVPTALKCAAMAVVPNVEGWTLRVFTLKGTKKGEPVPPSGSPRASGDGRP